MTLHWIDISILIVYLLAMVVVGFVVERQARQGIGHYFLGGNKMPWWVLSMSNAASMFDISGTIWIVYLLFTYGLKSVFIPWLWPIFNQIFLMVYLSTWLRRSGVMTGGEWITLRFGKDLGAEISRISVVLFALASVIGFTGYAFVGIAKFSAEFLPSGISPNTYAIAIVAITTLYTAVGGLYSVVFTDLIQFVIMVLCSFALAALALARVTPEQISAVTPAGWSNIGFGWKLDLNWENLIPAVGNRISADGYEMFGAFFLMMVFKGILVSAAGPAPNYDMQRILAAKSPREASLMSGLVSVVLFVPRYLMIAAITVLALVYLSPQVAAGNDLDMETVLPIVIRDFLPVGLTGIMIAGLLAAFMSTFAGTVNAAAAYLVNDVYKRYWKPHASDRDYVRVSYFASLLLVILGCAAGYYTPSVHSATEWIVAALWGGYAAPNLLKWHWWRLNGQGYFWGMISGLSGALALLAFPDIKPLHAFPFLLLVSTTGSVLGSLLTRQQDQQTLQNFYFITQPWGFWKPIEEAVCKTHAEFVPNRSWPRDCFNILVGVGWQTAFITLPIYVVIQEWHKAALSLIAVAVGSIVLKFSWYDHLEDSEQTEMNSRSHIRYEK